MVAGGSFFSGESDARRAMSRVPGFGIAPPRAPALAAVSNAFAIDATEPAVATGAAFSSFSAEQTPSAAGVERVYTSECRGGVQRRQMELKGAEGGY